MRGLLIIGRSEKQCLEYALESRQQEVQRLIASLYTQIHIYTLGSWYNTSEIVFGVGINPVRRVIPGHTNPAIRFQPPKVSTNTSNPIHDMVDRCLLLLNATNCVGLHSYAGLSLPTLVPKQPDKQCNLPSDVREISRLVPSQHKICLWCTATIIHGLQHDREDEIRRRWAWKPPVRKWEYVRMELGSHPVVASLTASGKFSTEK
jgi:hypothetical protein